MSFASAATLAITASLRNRIRKQLQRLRQPKYLVGAAAAGFYFWSLFFRGSLAHGSAEVGTFLPLEKLFLIGLGLLSILGGWILGGDEAALKFSEAEAQFFFPGPISRRALLHYKALRVLLTSSVSAAIFTVVIGMRTGGQVGFFFVGAWLGLSTVALHLNAASLTRASLVEHGLSGLKRQLLTLLIAIAVGGLLVYGTLHALKVPLGSLDPSGVLAWIPLVLSTPPLSWALYPLTAPLAVAFAPGAHAFLLALPGALLVLAAHYLWVISSNSAFEVASLEAAEKRAKRGSGTGGQGTRIRRSKPLFALSSAGAPAMAIFWKNLVAATRVLSLRFLISIGIFAVVGAFIAWGMLDEEGAHYAGRMGVLGAVFAMMAGYLALLGPQTFRVDFRLDLPQLDVLRAYPLSGRSVVTAEILAPAAVLGLASVLFLMVGAALATPFPIGGLSGAERWALVLAAALVLPPFTLSGLLIQNAAALLFPSWITADVKSARGFDAMGQRLLMLAGAMLTLVVGLVPGLILGGGAAFLLWHWLGLWVAPIAALCMGFVLLFEAYVALGLLGMLYERFEVTEA